MVMHVSGRATFSAEVVSRKLKAIINKEDGSEARRVRAGTRGLMSAFALELGLTRNLMAARRFVRRSFAAAGSFLGGHGILNLDLTRVDQAFDRLVGQVLIRDLPGLTGPQVKGLTPWQSHSERLVCLVQDGFHGRPPANGPIVFYRGSPRSGTSSK